MTTFGWLFLATAAITFVALARLRPCTLIVAGNQAAVLRALDHIAQFGQPRSQGFLPASVFSAESLATAQAIFALSTAILLCFVLLPGPRRAPVARGAPSSPALPVVPRPLFALLLAYLVAYVFSQRTIFSASYADPDRVVSELSLSGAHAFLVSIFLYEIVRRAIEGRLSRSAAFVLLFGVFVITDYSKGQTGIATGFLVTGACLIVSGERRPHRRLVALGAALASIVVLSVTVRGVRQSLHEQGAASLSEFASRLRENEEDVSRTGEGVETFGNGVQYAAHVLECINLYRSGLSRQWRSIYLPVVYTFQPSFLAGPLGFTRAQEAPQELADYYIHGGGIYLSGELYWNGGMVCVGLVTLALCLLCFLCDTRFTGSFAWLLFICNFGPSLLQGMGYGMAQVERGLFNGLLALGVHAGWKLLRARRDPGNSRYRTASVE